MKETVYAVTLETNDGNTIYGVRSIDNTIGLGDGLPLNCEQALQGFIDTQVKGWVALII